MVSELGRVLVVFPKLCEHLVLASSSGQNELWIQVNKKSQDHDGTIKVGHGALTFMDIYQTTKVCYMADVRIVTERKECAEDS